ncbi:PREDICTED: DNA replication complex GINS protein SLD5 [Tarenaya hassleriana]|uniref:DNA replication complex GINS protein SLD5 n=1 Tax=Tarenaya hassleriana TaxID=28532 RepID=UPI00053C496D|nr:PREDICTED: DNA replication complex GINS protein SLD5 [Tarenaya hassleriana]XP_010558448.1 PREDICTED: DNA replication complex GINS protein SLD5 [Tarenaya hassleriana]
MASNSEMESTDQMGDYETLISSSDVELLMRAWRNEKAAPEILQYEAALVERTKEQIELVEETIEEYVTSGIDPLVVSLYQMDLDRTQFLLRSYLRVRLMKIEKYMFHSLKSEDAERRLSEQEKTFARRCADDLAKHLEESVLLKLPENYQSVLKQSVISEGDDMVPQPHLDTFVVSKSKNFVSLNLYEEGESPETVEMEHGDLYFIRYKIIKRAVESGQIDLL